MLLNVVAVYTTKMSTNSILCEHCRQRLSAKPSETKVKCSQCNLESRTNNQHNSSSAIIEKCPIRIPNRNSVRKFLRNESPKKFSLNCKPSPLQYSSTSSRPKKRAVLCGVTYKKGKFRLKGTVNDVVNIRDMLIGSFEFKIEGILVLTEQEEEQMHIPTRKNIEKALQWLVKDCQGGDSLVFYFSGHGLRQPDFNRDEIDGFDETICPVDFLKEGMILDNDINSMLVKPLKHGVTLHAIVDACHSGTILDLEHVYDNDKRMWMDNRPPSGVTKATSGGLAICLSACEDNQLASDTSAFTGRTMNGVLTYILTEIVKKRPEISYGRLLEMIYERIDQVKENDCLMNTNFLKKFFKDRLSQKPLLSSSEKFDVDKKLFIF